MTEYDYSPEAYERHMQTQQRTAHWVNQTEQHRPEFSSDSESRTRPSLLQRLTHRRQSHSMHEPQHGRSSSSSSSSCSSSEPDSNLPRSLGPMPAPTYQPMYVRPQTTPPTAAYYQPKHSGSRHHHHHSSHHSSYVLSPPASPPAQGYPYPYGAATSPGHALSPGPYVYPQKAGATAVGTPSYFQPTQQSYYPQTSYPFPPTYTQTQQPPPHTAPAATYGYYGQGQAPLLASPPAQYPQSAAYPPTIYPLTSYGGQQQQLPQKPVFYQRIFSGSGSKKGKKSSRRGY